MEEDTRSEYDINIILPNGRESKTIDGNVEKLKKLSKENLKSFREFVTDLFEELKGSNFEMDEISLGLGVGIEGNIGIISGNAQASISISFKRKKK